MSNYFLHCQETAAYLVTAELLLQAMVFTVSTDRNAMEKITVIYKNLTVKNKNPLAINPGLLKTFLE